MVGPAEHFTKQTTTIVAVKKTKSAETGRHYLVSEYISLNSQWNLDLTNRSYLMTWSPRYDERYSSAGQNYSKIDGTEPRYN